MKQARLGIHTRVTNGDDHDHAWISYETTEGIIYYGLWSLSTADLQHMDLVAKGVEGLPKINENTDIQVGLETLLSPTKSSYFDLIEEQQKKFDEFIQTPRVFHWREYNCADLAAECMEAVLDKKLDIKRDYESKGAKNSVTILLSHADQLQNYLDVVGPERPPQLVDPDKANEIKQEPATAIQEHGFFATIYNKVMRFFGSDRGSSPNLAAPAKPLPARQENASLATPIRRDPERPADEPKEVAQGRSEYQPGSHKPEPKESGRDKDDRIGRSD